MERGFHTFSPSLVYISRVVYELCKVNLILGPLQLLKIFSPQMPLLLVPAPIYSLEFYFKA